MRLFLAGVGPGILLVALFAGYAVWKFRREYRTAHAVFLTGGSSYIPAVRGLFSKRFGEERIRTADAFTSVVEGLGRATASLLAA